MLRFHWILLLLRRWALSTASKSQHKYRLVEDRYTHLRNIDLTILGRQRDDDGQNKLLQINGSKDNSSYIINRLNLIQS
jgi:hypothetical protein